MPSPLNLSAEDYWGDFTRTADPAFDKFIEENDFVGLRVDAPAQVPIDRRDSFPVVGYYVRTVREDVQVDPEEQLLVAALDLTTHRLHAGLALDTGKTRAPKGPPSDLDPGDGVTYNAFSSDLRRQLDLPWEKRKYLVAFAIREHLSNPLRVELAPSPLAYRDPAVEDFLAEQRKKAPFVPPLPVSPEPKPELGVTYQRVSRSPEVPKEPGIALAIDRVAVARRGSSCLCFGSFRLPVTVGELVRPDPATGKRPEVGDSEAKCIVPITLFITGSEAPGPWLVELRVPSYDAVAVPKGAAPPPEEEVGVVTGFFALDLLQHPGMPRGPMTYFVSAFGGATVNGPFQVAIVTEKMLKDAGAAPT
jgi:hypothetical protein